MAQHDAAAKVADAILALLVGDRSVGETTVEPNPAAAVRRATHVAARKAAAAAGTLALPPGPLGWLTVLPEMITVWKIQATLVTDIAALYGKKGSVTREQMLYCLFKHSASQAVRDLVVRAGERWVVKKASLMALQAVARRIGVKVTQQGVSKAASRWLPVVGAAGVAAYAYYDTMQVAKAASALFERAIDFDDGSAPALAAPDAAPPQAEA
ncbi:MAG: hypothetical protein U1F53_06170 [Burkholderiaceae bacterium]